MSRRVERLRGTWSENQAHALAERFRKHAAARTDPEREIAAMLLRFEQARQYRRKRTKARRRTYARQNISLFAARRRIAMIFRNDTAEHHKYIHAVAEMMLASKLVPSDGPHRYVLLAERIIERIFKGDV